jgi:hypothetical protein
MPVPAYREQEARHHEAYARGVFTSHPPAVNLGGCDKGGVAITTIRRLYSILKVEAIFDDEQGGLGAVL